MSIQEEMGKLNTYTARVDRSHPTAFVFLIDQSGSMSESVGYADACHTKAELVANAINKIIDELLNRCTKPDEIRHYFDIALIGYGACYDRANFIKCGNIDREGWLTPAELKDVAMYRKETITQSIRGVSRSKEIDVPYWIEPTANYRTPMKDAFDKAQTLLQDWCTAKVGQDCYPPVLINITDGFVTDATKQQMLDLTNEVKSITTMDGNVLVFNIHLSSDNSSNSIVFPSNINEVGDEYSQMLYEMSSTLPKLYNNDIKALTQRAPSFKAMGYNAVAVDFVRMLNIGTITNMSNNEE